MNLYLISQSENQDWDTYDSAVVAAPDEETARNMDPSDGSKISWGTRNYAWCRSADSVTVHKLGVAENDTPIEVICASFNAG